MSSTWQDLQPERRALMEALNRMEEMRFVGMEFFGNRPDDTHDASIDQVDLCQVYVGVIGFRYGSGITEAEYRRARELGLPCFVYFKREDLAQPGLTDGDPAQAARLAEFKARMLQGHTVREFGTPGELAANATADLHNWVAAQWVTSRESSPARSQPRLEEREQADVRRLLGRVRHDWVEGVLEASLHHRAWVDLGIKWQDEAVAHPWDSILVTPDRPVQTLARRETIAAVFTGAQNTLLVLGEPGAGKTTTLLELTRALVEAAEQGSAAVPVVLALSTWTGRHRTMAEWIVDELNLRYQVPKRIAGAWLEQGRLALMLDGLDEVRTEFRPGCVAALNRLLLEQMPAGVALTCRVAEYAGLPERLRLQAAICLQPLTATQIEAYFDRAGPALQALRAAVVRDPALRELAQTPLMLSVMALAWSGETGPQPRDQNAPATLADRQRQLFAAYVETALRRKGQGRDETEGRTLLGVLRWLAGRMNERSLSLFSMEQLQPDWLGRPSHQFLYLLITRLMAACFFAIPFWLLPTPATAGNLRLPLLGLALVVGGCGALVDFAVLRWGSDEGSKPATRAWRQLIVMLLIAMALGIGGSSLVGFRSDDVLFFAFLYLWLAAMGLALPADVKRRDIRVADSLAWSWKLCLTRAAMAVIGLQWLLFIVIAAGVATAGWSRPVAEFLGAPACWIGGGIGLGVGLVLRRKGSSRRGWTDAGVIIASGLLGAEVSLLGFGTKEQRAVATLFLTLGALLAVVIGVFGGVTSGTMEVSRVRRIGLWYWLKVPVLTALGIGALLGGLTLGAILLASGRSSDLLSVAIIAGSSVGGVFAMVAFFVFGGVNGLQHLVLRCLLWWSGRLPWNPAPVLELAVRLNLLQRVGFGFRFVHALLLEHFAAGEGADTGRIATPGRGSPPMPSA